ncbi:MAG: VirB8/TrbF family protein [Vulcanimicrobiaceae bacterium]
MPDATRVGAPSEAQPNGSDPYVGAQVEALADTERAWAVARSFRRLASGLALAVLIALVSNVVLASKYQHDVLVFRETNHGLSYAGEAQQSLAPDELAIEQQLGAFVRALRDVPGLDYALVDRDVSLALLMTADVTPYHAHQDVMTYFRDPANNPKLLGKMETRAVLDPVIASPITGTRTWTVSWVEETVSRQGQGKKSRKLYQGTVTIAPPSIPTDRQTASLDAAGVVVVQYDLHL